MMSDLLSPLSLISFIETGHLLAALAELFAPAETPTVVRMTISTCAHGFMGLLTLKLMWQGLPAAGNGLKSLGLGIVVFHTEANLFMAVCQDKARKALAWISDMVSGDD